MLHHFLRNIVKIIYLMVSTVFNVNVLLSYDAIVRYRIQNVETATRAHH